MNEQTNTPDLDISPEASPRRGSRRSKLEALSDETLAQMRNEMERTGLGAMRLMRGAHDRPKGFSAQMIDSWLYGAVRSANPLHVEYVLARWAALPTNKRKTLTPEMSATLSAEIDRTAMNAITFLRADDIPDGLNWPMVISWVKQTTNTFAVAHWNYVTERLRALPDLSFTPRREIEQSDLAELRHHRDRTCIGGAVLLRTATDKPAGLTPSMISSWLNGVTKTANPEHVAYVLARYRAWP